MRGYSFMRLTDKVAVITGAARGIGKAIAKRFVSEGATVIITDINATPLYHAVDELGAVGKTEGSLMNVTKYDSVQSIMGDIIKKYSRIDILVNNAGITADAMLAKMTEQQFDSVMQVNLKGVFCCTKAVASSMTAHGYGRIINIASVTAHNGNFGQTNYAASKAGVISMTHTWAKELGKKGVTVNAVAPGYIMTEMMESVPEKILENIVAKTPARRLGKPEEVAAACAFLASDEAAFVNGAVLNVDGGLVL